MRWQTSIKDQRSIVPQNIKHEKNKNLDFFALTTCAVIEGMFDSKLVIREFVGAQRNEN